MEAWFNVQYRGGKIKYVLTPRSSKIGKRLARRSYPSFTKSVVSNFSNHTVTAVCKQAHDEMNHLSSTSTDSVMARDNSIISAFSWDVLWLEFQQHVPTLVSIFVGLTSKSGNMLKNRPLICLLIATDLKRNHQRMSLVQRIISIFLYGNAVHKQVNICYI